MKRTINFKKDQNNNYIFEEPKTENKLTINSNDKKLSGQELYNAFFKDEKFKIDDSFELNNEIKTQNGTDNHIFTKMKELFKEIEKQFKESHSNVVKDI